MFTAHEKLVPAGKALPAVSRLIRSPKGRAMGHIQQSVVRSSHDVPMRFFPCPWTNRQAGGLLGPCRYEPAPSPIDVLTERFPVIHRLVGDESFRAMASRFIDRE